MVVFILPPHTDLSQNGLEDEMFMLSQQVEDGQSVNTDFGNCGVGKVMKKPHARYLRAKF